MNFRIAVLCDTGEEEASEVKKAFIGWRKVKKSGISQKRTKFFTNFFEMKIFLDHFREDAIIFYVSGQKDFPETLKRGVESSSMRIRMVLVRLPGDVNEETAITNSVCYKRATFMEMFFSKVNEFREVSVPERACFKA